jgi:protein SMG9
MLPPFTVQSEDNRAMARHCTVGIEPRISAERLILLDTQVRLFFYFFFIIEVTVS